MFLLMRLYVLSLVTFISTATSENACVFRHAGSGGQTVLIADATPQSDNTTVCSPGAIEFHIPIESHEDIVISWTAAPCQVSGYFIDLSEVDGISASLTTDLCNETKINLKRNMARFFSRYSVEVRSARVLEDGRVIKSKPSTNQFPICPNRKPESPVDVRVEVYSDSSISITWKSTETLWQIQYFILQYCEENAGCKVKSRTLSAEMSVRLLTLRDKKYDIELYSVSNTDECGEAQGRSYRTVLFGRNIISDFDVNCTRDDRHFYASLNWKIDPEKFDHIRPTFSFDYSYKVSGTDILKNSTESYDLRKVCDPDRGECSLRLERLLRVDSHFEFGIAARALDSVVYYAGPSDKAKCILRTRALTHTEVAIIDKTQNFTSMIESMDTQRVIVIDKDIFSQTDGAIVTSMVVIGDPALMRRPLGRKIPFKRAVDKQGRLQPTRITPTDWNIFSVWNTLQSRIDDPVMRCAWMWGSPSDYVVCAVGVEKCTDSPVKSCNRPLTTNKAYGLKIRGCTRVGCADTNMLHFELGNVGPDSDTSETFDENVAFEVLLVLIMCIIFGGIAIVVLAVLLLRWSEMRQMHHEQRFQLIDFERGIGESESSIASQSPTQHSLENPNKLIF